jgi:Domain of unknown function (DUF4062)
MPPFELGSAPREQDREPAGVTDVAYRAFVSSTFEDLHRHRKRVIDTLRRSGISVDPMEDWGASSKAPSVFSQERIDGCDLCVLLVARRRGHVPKGRRKSITQLEYEAAARAGIDVLVFMLDDHVSWPGRFDELDQDGALQKWRGELLETKGIERFGADPRSLDIAPSLVRWISERQLSDLASGRRPESLPWNPKALRLGQRYGLLRSTSGVIEFTPEVAESLRKNGDDWIRGRPLAGSNRVLADWMEYSAMSIVVATTPGTVLSVELQDVMYIECQHQLISFLLDTAVRSGVMTERDGTLSVSDDLNEEMLEVFEHPEELDPYETETSDPRDATMLAFVAMVRARLLIHLPVAEAYAEALGTIVLSTFNFWQGPANAGSVILSKARPGPRKSSKPRQKRKAGPPRTGNST